MTAVGVCAIVRRGPTILVVRPTDPSTGRWTLPTDERSGDDDPRRVAAEVAGEYVDGGAPSPRRRGGPVPLGGDGHVEVVLLDVADGVSAAAPPGWEARWIHPHEADGDDADPGLWAAYEAVAPTVRSVAADADHGSTYLSLRALEVLRDRAAVAAREDGELDELVSLGRELRSARPDMVALKVRVAAALDDAASPADVRDRAASAAAAAHRADRRAAAVAAEAIGDASAVFVFSRSGTVDRCLERLEPARLVTTVADPGGEGVAVAERWADRCRVHLGPDAAAGHLLAEDVDAVIVGADGIDADGTVTNKVGTHTVAAAAAALDVPVVVAAATAKIAGASASTERAPPGTVYDGSAPLEVRSERFDRTPASLVDRYCTEEGTLDRARIAELAGEHDRLLGAD